MESLQFSFVRNAPYVLHTVYDEKWNKINWSESPLSVYVCQCAYHNTCSKYLQGILIIFLARSLLSAQLNLMNMSIMKEMSIWDKLISIDTTEQHEKRKELSIMTCLSHTHLATKKGCSRVGICSISFHTFNQIFILNNEMCGSHDDGFLLIFSPPFVY